MEARESLVIRDAEGGEGFIEMNMEPVDADVQIASENKRYDGSREDPEIGENRGIVNYGAAARK